MADAAVEFLLENLKQLLVHHVKLIADSKDQVELLYSDLVLLKAFVKDSTEKRSKNENLKELLKQIRKVVYEAEDAIDIFVAQTAVHQARGQIKKTFRIFHDSNKLSSVTRDLKAIQVKVKDIYKTTKFESEAIHDVGEGSEGSKNEKKASIVEEDYVVGFEDEAIKVINLLTEGSDDLEVVSIIGMPGLGKTTLANMIYRDPRIEYEYYNRAWVYVSQEYSRKKVLLTILGNLDQLNDAMYRMNEENLGEELYKALVKEKYLIVMDDVWTEEAWNDLKNVFPKNNKRSRILITSRIKGVAKHANPYKEPHDLRFLTFDESWILLQKKSFTSDFCPPELERDGKRIAKECQGLPLALVVIGGILLGKGTNRWAKVAESVDAYMDLDLDLEHRMDNFIGLSYNHLPLHLKPCFLYFGMFPEGFEIPVWQLIRLWIAEGFSQSRDEMSLEDIAEEYLEDLVNRNLVMAGDRRSNGKIKTCRVHDMLHQFCKMEAGKENFFQEIEKFDRGTYMSSNPSPETYRRLCIHTGVLDYLSSKPKEAILRSFLCFSSEEIILSAEHISSIPAAFKLLRVLDSRPMVFTCFPTRLTRLIHMRYIVLSSNFKILPAAISSLWNMQTFVVETTSRTLDIKADVWNMTQLRHVKTNAITSLPSPLSRTGKDEVLILGNLQTLSTIAPESCTEEVFSRTPNLKKLGVKGHLSKLLESRGGSISFDSLGKLGHLENLKLLNDVFPSPLSEGKLRSLPQRYKFPPKLKKLTLSDTLLDWNDMSTLGMLQNLEILKLKNNAFMGEWWQCEDDGFRALRVFHIGRTDLVTWQASSHHFPRLRQLYLKHCTKLVAIPSGFCEVSSLQLVDMYCTNKSAVASARAIQRKKMEAKVDQSTKSGGFKLSIYPPDQ